MAGLGDVGMIVVNTGFIIIGSILIFGAIVVVYLMYMKQVKRYNHKCIIFEMDGLGNIICTTDVAGIFVDGKTKNKRFFLKKNNVGLNPDKVPYIQEGKVKKVYLKRLGLKNFAYINYAGLFTGEETITVGDEDVNWAINAYDRSKAVFGTTMLEKLLPYLGLILMAVFIIGMIAILMNKIPTVIDKMSELAEILKQMEQIRSGTTIIQ